MNPNEPSAKPGNWLGNTVGSVDFQTDVNSSVPCTGLPGMPCNSQGQRYVCPKCVLTWAIILTVTYVAWKHRAALKGMLKL